jgi:hypothetical protein
MINRGRPSTPSTQRPQGVVNAEKFLQPANFEPLGKDAIEAVIALLMSDEQAA